MTDRDRWNLRGPVRIASVDRTWHVAESGADSCERQERGDSSRVEFGPDGSLLLQSVRNSDGTEWVATRHYDETGRLLEVRSGDGATVYRYSASGALEQVISRGADGQERLAETYGKDAAGRAAKTMHLVRESAGIMFSMGVEGTDSGYSAAGAASATTAHEPDGRLSELVFRDAGGRLLSRVEFRYDDAGHLVEEAHTAQIEGLPAGMLQGMTPAQAETVRGLFSALGSRLHRYDERGRRIETSSEGSLLGGDRRLFQYNEHGDPVEEVSEMVSRDFGVDEEGKLSAEPTRENVSRTEARISYDYDTHGNWTRKLVESRSAPDRPFAVASEERRTIEYFR